MIMMTISKQACTLYVLCNCFASFLKVLLIVMFETQCNILYL